MEQDGQNSGDKKDEPSKDNPNYDKINNDTVASHQFAQTTSSNGKSKDGCDGPKQKQSEESEAKDSSNDGFAKPKATFISPSFRVPKRATANKVKNVISEQEKSTSNETSQDSTAPPHQDQEDSVVSEEKKSSQNVTKRNQIDTKTERHPCPYKAPSWSTICTEDYYFDVLKGGVMKSPVDLTEKDHYVFGRLEDCDVMLEHPSISRYHAVVVYKGISSDESSEQGSSGFYLMDLGSTHGTFLNKMSLNPKVYYRLKVGYGVRFGGSTRLYILQGPQTDQDEEIEKSTFEIKEQSKKSREEKVEFEDEDSTEKDEGVSWGFGEDAAEEEIDLEKMLASRKPLELKDPKKTLRGFFEREGLDLEYDTDEKGAGHNKVYVARVKLPIENAAGEEIVAEGSASKKKEAVAACAYEACRIIDAHDLLRNAMHESERSKRAKMLAENDYYDSDEDSFLDRTGSVESKRKKRLKRAGKGEEEKVETYDSLVELLDTAMKEINTLQKTLEKDEQANKLEPQEEIDELDRYMNTVTSRLDKKTIVAIKLRLTVLHKERRRLEKLIEIVKPISLPPLKPQNAEQNSGSKDALKEVKMDKESKQRHNDSDIQQTTSDKADVQAAKSHSKDQGKDNDPPPTSITNSSNNTQKRPYNVMSVASFVARTVEEDEGEHDPETANDAKRPKKIKKKKIYGAPTAPTSSDSKFADWVPPQGQAGDGKTHLNEKFGY
eukprot:gene20608-22641_t